MSEFANSIYLDCTATIACSECGDQEDAHGDTDGEALRNLERTLKQSGWQCFDDLAYCPRCARKREEAEESAKAKPQKRKRKVSS
jgi:hypothetical protein